jgi:hypothetical protein
MTARESTFVMVDAATVYAEGMLAGLRHACAIVGRQDAGAIPPQLSRLVTEWRANVIHREWLAQQGRPVPHEESEQARSRIFAVLVASGLAEVSP